MLSGERLKPGSEGARIVRSIKVLRYTEAR
jgi:hypothetical protein